MQLPRGPRTRRLAWPHASAATGVVRAALAWCVVSCVVGWAAGCGLDDGERFGRAGARPGLLRVHLLEEPAALDPTRARTPVEHGLARELFAALVEVEAVGAAGRTTLVTPALAERWELIADDVGARLRVTLRADARFSDEQLLTAEDVVWSWRRALRPSTAAVDLSPLQVIRGGRELASRALLRVDSDGARGRPPPYALYRDGPGDVLVEAELPAYAAVRVVDTNARVPCCDIPVSLRRTPEEAAPAAASLLPGEAAVVIAARDVPDGQRAVSTWIQLRAPSGAAGWARAGEVKVHIPAIGLAHVVDRAGDGVPLRAGPHDDAPARALLTDDDMVEVLERASTSEPGLLARVIDLESGRAGWLPEKNLDDTVRERRWYLVESVETGARAWLAEEELTFDPGLLDARALDARTLELGLATGTSDDDALRALAAPVMRPVPARLVEAWGTAWTEPARIVTSGPFHLVELEPRRRVVLARSPSSVFAARARVERVELVVLENRTSALHLYRAGLVDAILDGALPPELHTTLSRARDHTPGAAGGALIAPEVMGLPPAPLSLRDVEVRP